MRPYLLTAGAFAVGSTTYVVSGVLPAVVAGLEVSPAAAGQLATSFALAYAVSAPLLASLTGRWERRTLLTTALLVVALGNVITAASTVYPLVIAGRVVAALGAAVYTPAATLVATQLLGADQRGRAVALVFGGLTLAMLVGVPAGNLLGAPLGYQGVFGIAAAVSVLAAVAVRMFLPRVDAPPVVGLRERLAVAADRRALTLLAITVFGVLSAMSVYTYVVPLVVASAGVAPTTGMEGPTEEAWGGSGLAIGVLLAVYGLGAVVGNALGGRATDRFGASTTLTVVMVGFVAVIATFPLTGTTAVGAGTALFVWSVFTWAFNPPQQNVLLGLAPAGGLLLSLNASAIFLGAGLSGVVGGLVIDTLGVLALPVVSAVLGLVALALWLTVRRPAARERAPVASTA